MTMETPRFELFHPMGSISGFVSLQWDVYLDAAGTYVYVESLFGCIFNIIQQLKVAGPHEKNVLN